MRARITLAALAAVVLGTAAVAVGANAADPTTSAGSPAATPALSVSAGTAAVPAVQADIASNFALFRNAPAPVPHGIASAIASSDRYGRNAQLARAIQTPNGTGWVIPGDGWMCIAMPDRIDGYGESCSPTSQAIRRGLWLRLAGDSPDASAVDVLLVPDGAGLQEASSKALSVGGPGVVTHVGVGSDPPPAIAAG